MNLQKINGFSEALQAKRKLNTSIYTEKQKLTGQ